MGELALAQEEEIAPTVPIKAVAAVAAVAVACEMTALQWLDRTGGLHGSVQTNGLPATPTPPPPQQQQQQQRTGRLAPPPPPPPPQLHTSGSSKFWGTGVAFMVWVGAILEAVAVSVAVTMVLVSLMTLHFTVLPAAAVVEASHFSSSSSSSSSSNNNNSSSSSSSNLLQQQQLLLGWQQRSAEAGVGWGWTHSRSLLAVATHLGSSILA
jgi:hypothetical protein